MRYLRTLYLTVLRWLVDRLAEPYGMEAEHWDWRDAEGEVRDA